MYGLFLRKANVEWIIFLFECLRVVFMPIFAFNYRIIN